MLLGQAESVSTTLLKVFVQDAGVYPIRTIYQEVTGSAYIEIFMVKADGSTVLINDANGFKAYRVGVAPNKSAVFTVTAGISAGQIQITWTEPGVVLQESTNLTSWADLTTATSPYKPAVGAHAAAYYRLKK